MLNVRDYSVLKNIIKHCLRVESKTQYLTLEKFTNDLDVKEIVCFNILQIGELSKQLTDSFVKKYNAMPWRDIKGMRDVIAHGYGTIDEETVWKTAINDIKPLRDYCDKIIKETS